MKASRWINLPVHCGENGQVRGLIKDIRIRDGCIDALVLSMGGLWSKALFIRPEDIVTLSADVLKLSDESALKHLSAKEMKAAMAGSDSLFKLTVVDYAWTLIGRVSDARVGEDCKVQEFEISRSFFDDMDRGYAVIPMDQMTSQDGVLHYQHYFYEIPQSKRSGGVFNKVLGED
ncbi:hypothetical protein [Eubacterium aggregans]|uniref:hypothetical protein n=1 Tax=Eubacterium aggregans TaxID=81409 RepID=UPI003F3814FA